MKSLFGATFSVILLAAASALAQTTPSPVTPQTCAVTSVATGGTAVTALAGPANGFALQNTAASAALYYSLTGAATSSTIPGGGTFALAAGQSFVFPAQLMAGVSLSVNAAATQPFSCMRW